MQKVGTQIWYGWSIYLDPSYPDLWKSNAMFGQVKMRNWRLPIWSIKLKQGKIALWVHAEEECSLGRLDNWRGNWVDFAMFADYSTNPAGPSIVLYVYGERACTYSNLLVTPAMEEVENGELYLKYGIYNSFVSRWLDRNKTQNVVPLALVDKFDRANGSQDQTSSPAANPFAYDWGVELPTQVVYYDEMRYGTTREQVDVRMIEARGGRPVD